jgi:DNA polymerase elongation subunit (family B)
MFRDDTIDIDEDVPFQFQIHDWYTKDVSFQITENTFEKKYVIKAFGVDKYGHSVSVNINNYTPYFYISSKKKFNDVDIDLLKIAIKSKIQNTFEQDFDLKLIKRKSIWGFTNNTLKQFIQITCKSKMCFYVVKKLLYKRISFNSNNIKFKQYETNIDPLLRFIHYKNIQPCGWVNLSNFINCNELIETKCQINLSTDWQDIDQYESTQIAPLHILSFDIECNSADGSFPQAQKTYSNFVNQLVDIYRTFDIENRKENILNAIKGAFKLIDNSELSKLYTKTKYSNDHINQLINFHFDDIIEILNKQIHHVQTIHKGLENKFDNYFPELIGDEIIQIGSTIHKYGDSNCSYKNILTLGSCDKIDGVDVIECETERELIIEWCNLINRIDPDIITGYNILGFDFDYLYKRAIENDCVFYISSCSKLDNHKSAFVEKMLSSSALGDNILKYVEMEGRVIIDLMKVVQREYKLDSYKLDNVVKSFINGKILQNTENTVTIDNVTGINKFDYIYCGDIKYMIIDIVDYTLFLDKNIVGIQPKHWGLAKDDVSPNEIFKCQKGTSSDRAKIAKYCVQDCALCNSLIIKLEIIANNCGMANVCFVPLSYIFMRGQGIKIFSLFSKQCKEDKFIIPVLKYDENEIDDNGYEGAIVLDPTPGIYVKEPISVMDYASLYPSSMISENISHDSIVIDDKYDNLPNIDYVDITYDVFSGVGDKKIKIDEKTCRYAQPKNNEKSVLPRILMKLLSQRKETRNKIKHKTLITNDDTTYTCFVLDDSNDYKIKCVFTNEIIEIDKNNVKSCTNTYNEFMIAVLDGLQMAYKITANSLYGQVGARTSQIYMKELAASTTATGRDLILKAKQFMESNYNANVIYGDTDSIFVDFKVSETYNLYDKEALQKSIDISIDASSQFKKTLKAPHDLEYEKTFWPFIILSKKKYVGNLYEFDVNKFKQKSMGIVLKRRDNANLVKIVYGGIIDILLKKHDIQIAIEFLNKSLIDLIDGKIDMSDLIITKTLRQKYADPTRIAHKVLADRMKHRDPGSAPQVNDRIPYIYIQHNSKIKLLQGDKIEHPTYIIDNKLKIDYTFYITNQLLKPICQLLALSLFDIPKCKKSPYYYEKKYKSLLKDNCNKKKSFDKIQDLKQVEVKELLFDGILNDLNNAKLGNRTILEFFQKSM